ncbi:MAG: hypothetical protein ORN21_05890 [Methylophilaceae bacterium]|nr:hypothetical protein [Methylophilaceae bacterium]
MFECTYDDVFTYSYCMARKAVYFANSGYRGVEKRPAIQAQAK